MGYNKNMNKPVILTGLQPSNDLHIGNFFGAVLPMVDMAQRRADEYQLNLMVADLHTLTTPTNYAGLQANITENLKFYVAAGLPIDHANVRLFRQSYVPAHSELAWIVDCFTGMGEMGRMTQFKDKSTKLHEDRISVGLFNYPVLMACDVLLYNAAYVPVGDDQSQHLEFTRDIAMRINNQFGELLTVPLSVPKQHEFFGKDQGLRIRNLIDPSKKMSKSDETGKGVIFLSDTPEVARKKVMGAATDSYGEVQFDFKERSGVSNLLQMLALLAGKSQSDVNKQWGGQTSYGDLKKAVADAVAEFLADFQAKLLAVDEQTLIAKLAESEKAMNETANATLLRVQKAVGLRA